MFVSLSFFFASFLLPQVSWDVIIRIVTIIVGVTVFVATIGVGIGDVRTFLFLFLGLDSRDHRLEEVYQSDGRIAILLAGQLGGKFRPQGLALRCSLILGKC